MVCFVGSSSSESDELQEEEVRTYQPAAPEEEAQIDGSPAAWRQSGVLKFQGCSGGGCMTCCNRHV